MSFIPNIATPIIDYTQQMVARYWLQCRQGWRWLGLVFTGKKPRIIFFEAIQQDLIHDVPAYLCWEAEHYYKATINGVDVTFDKSPLLFAKKYSGQLQLTVFGLAGKVTQSLLLQVKAYNQTKKLKVVGPVIQLVRTKKFLTLQQDLHQLSKKSHTTLKTKAPRLAVTKAKLPTLEVNVANIMPPKWLEKVAHHATYHEYQQDLLTELHKSND